MQRALFAALCAFAPYQAHAALVTVGCNFHTECFDTEPCRETNYDMSFKRDTNPPLFQGGTSSVWTMQPGQFAIEVNDDMSEPFKAVPFGHGDAYGFTSFGDDKTQLLLTVKNGVGRYSIHMLEEEIALFYLGTCAEVTS